jgi:hypothetical protein
MADCSGVLQPAQMPDRRLGKLSVAAAGRRKGESFKAARLGA